MANGYGKLDVSTSNIYVIEFGLIDRYNLPTTNFQFSRKFQNNGTTEGVSGYADTVWVFKHYVEPIQLSHHTKRGGSPGLVFGQITSISIAWFVIEIFFSC